VDDLSEVDFLVTTIREIGGELVSTNQPFGRVMTVPNSTVLGLEVTNFGSDSEYVWNELDKRISKRFNENPTCANRDR